MLWIHDTEHTLKSFWGKVQAVHVEQLLFISHVLVLWDNSLQSCIFKVQMFSVVTAKRKSAGNQQAQLLPVLELRDEQMNL